MTHAAYSSTQKLATPCASWHLTFGGLCLNCGWREPDLARLVPKSSGSAIDDSAAAVLRAWAEGRDANDMGRQRVSCPYENEYLRARWQAGWDHAEEDRQDATS